ncbi:MAG: exopolysaccharide biosynthesis protein [Phycisphaera sp.]|nr:MAG: exopolysaccharide biosynthesis protein [Phycisphaera sp.]
MPEAPKKLTDLINDLDEQIDGDASLAVSDILDAFGSRSFGPLLALPGLIGLTPLGAVPGAPAIIAAFVILVAGQHLFGRDHPWLPQKLTGRSVSKERWDKARDKARPWARRVDILLKPRLRWLTGSIMERVISLVSIALAVSMFPLGFIPFAVAAPAGAILFFGLALSARDGVAVVVALLATGGTAYMLWTMVL